MTVTRPALSRRRALAGAATAGIGLPLLAACGDDDPGAGTGAGSDAAGPAPTGPKTKGGGGGSTTAPVDGIATSDVPVGGGLIEGDVVITQPTEGEFKAFSAVCTHQQCLVGEVSDGTIICPCHGSRFSIEDGSVVDGPAPSPLGPADVTLRGDRVVVG
jgi:nitrite reductase/ring-hydroxylating ferredoxin subunit